MIQLLCSLLRQPQAVACCALQARLTSCSAASRRPRYAIRKGFKAAPASAGHRRRRVPHGKQGLGELAAHSGQAWPRSPFSQCDAGALCPAGAQSCLPPPGAHWCPLVPTGAHGCPLVPTRCAFFYRLADHQACVAQSWADGSGSGGSSTIRVFFVASAGEFVGHARGRSIYINICIYNIEGYYLIYVI